MNRQTPDSKRASGAVILNSWRHRHAVPPNVAFLAQAALEPGFEHSVEDHPRQGIACLACDQVGARGPGPDLEKLLGGHLVGNMPVGNAACRHGCKDLEGDLNLLLELDSAPVLGKLSMAALNGEWRVVVLAICGKQGAEHGIILVLPGCLVALH